MERFTQLFSRTKAAVIGMIHVAALPGSPRYCMTMDEIVSRACEEAHIYRSAKLDGIIVENMHDVPWLRPNQLGPETTAAMSVICAAVRRENPSLPIGVQILSCGSRAALAVAQAAGLDFVRAEGWVFAHIGDEGYTESCAAELTRYRQQIAAENILIFTDIKKKHSSHSITSDVNLGETVQAAELFLSDGVIVTGSSTGVAVNQNDLGDVNKAVQYIPVLVGSGVTVDNVDKYIAANALIVGTHFKVGSDWKGTVEPSRVQQFMDRINQLRSSNNSLEKNS